MDICQLNGGNWVNAGLLNQVINTLHRSNNIFAGTYAGVFSNNGGNWI
ncbi:MAG: hypothetical protein IPG02_14685 [Ignavibacteria bacterium]|nr:hypothetical protein [Ignavibacteria bacterium]